MILLDGAMGTFIQRSVKNPPKYTELLNTSAPEILTSLHRQYVEAGSNIVFAATFNCNRWRAAAAGYDVEENIHAAIANARASGAERVALDVSTLGKFLEPYGDLSEEEAREIFHEIAMAGRSADLAVVETMTDPREARIAAEEVKKATGLPVFMTLSFARGGKTITGTSPADAAREFEGLADAVGLNCSLGPIEALPLVREWREHTDLPLIAKPNAGMPDSSGNYALSPEDFARASVELAKAGAEYLGGCCGTAPEYIKALHEALRDAGLL